MFVSLVFHAAAALASQCGLAAAHDRLPALTGNRWRLVQVVTRGGWMRFEPFRQLLQRLALLAVTFGGSEAKEASATLGAIPQRVIADELDEAESGRIGGEATANLLCLLSFDPRPQVRAEVLAECLRLVDPHDTRLHRILVAIANDPDPALRPVAAQQLAALLERLRPLERTELIAIWATSAEPAERLAVAAALTHPIPALGVRTALSHLANDASPQVRSAARSALLLLAA
jgi:hypothetical protein